MTLKASFVQNASRGASDELKEAALDSIADQLLPVFEAQNSSSAFVEAIPAFVGDMFSRFHISQTNSLSPGYPRSGCQV